MPDMWLLYSTTHSGFIFFVPFLEVVSFMRCLFLVEIIRTFRLSFQFVTTTPPFLFQTHSPFFCLAFTTAFGFPFRFSLNVPTIVVLFFSRYSATFEICILVQFYHKHFIINFLTLARKLNFLTSNEVSTVYISNR
jgi:hypothetical protein